MARTPAGRELTVGHRAGQIAIAASLTELLRRTWPVLNPTDLQDSLAMWLRIVQPLVLESRGRSATLAAAYFAEYAFVETGERLTATVPSVTDDMTRALEISARVTGPTTIRTLVAGGMDEDAAADSAFSLFHESMGRHALGGGRETIIETLANTDVGWRRIGRADGKEPCDFCAMLIGRGEVYSSGVAEVVRFASHDGCKCQAEPAFDGGEPVDVRQYTASKRNITDADRARVREWLADERARKSA